MIYIVPSRGRPHAVTELIAAWEETRTVATLHVAVDDNDPTRHEYRAILRSAPAWVRWTLVAGGGDGMTAALNYCARLDAEHEDIIGFMGDDHRPRTLAWDAMIAQSWDGGGRVVYGNDLIHGPNLPTAVALDARIIQRLGFMAPPAQKHLFLDNFWKTLGERLGALRYLPQCVIEHMHPIAGKAEWDEGYIRVNAGGLYETDRAAYAHYIQTGRLAADIERIGDLSGV